MALHVWEFSFRDGDDDWARLSLSIRGFSTSMRRCMIRESVGIRNAGVQLLIGDRRMLLRVLLITNKDSVHGISWLSLSC